MTDVLADLLGDLRGVLREATGDPNLDFADRPRRLTGGFWARLVSFELAGAPPGWRGPLVARVMPDAAIAAKETAIQQAVADQGYPTPRVHLTGGPVPGIDGQAYLVMDHAAGAAMVTGLDGVAALRQLPSLARRLPDTLANVLAELHRLDPDLVLAALDATEVAHPTVPSMLSTMRANADGFGRGDLVDAIDWLATHPPREEPLVLCHGDMHPFNVLVTPDGSVTVLDWSAAILAPASYDLAFTSLLISEPPLLAPQPLRAIVRQAGKRLAGRFLRTYESTTGASIDRDALAWHQALIATRALAEVATWSVAGILDERRGHPWVIAAERFAARLSDLTGGRVDPH